MANQKQLEILHQGIDVWNAWFQNNIPFVTHIAVNLSGVDLTGADLSGALLMQVNLMNANLTRANLSRADLSDAILFGADLNAASLRESNLQDATLNTADLRNADLTGANLKGANLTDVMLENTLLVNTDLGDTFGLDELFHLGASTLDMSAIQRSRGKIPVEFLQGCGLSDLQIEMARLAAPGLDPEEVAAITQKINQLYLGGGEQYYSCFISYNNEDEDFARQLHDDLQNNGVRCWFAPEDMKIGDPIRTTIDSQIHARDKLLVILSENSIQSEWVGDEVEAALEKEKISGRLALFPIRLDDAVLNTHADWAAKVRRRRHIGDFSQWQAGGYQKAFERLLRDLKTVASSTERG